MKTTVSQEQINDTAVKLGIPTIPFFQRRIARAYDLVETNKVNEISHDDGLYRVQSQYEDKIYTVELNHGNPNCTCPDNERTIFCKHSIASMMMAFEQEQKASKLTIYDDSKGSRFGRWWITDYDAKKGYIVDRDSEGTLSCPCCSRSTQCKHKKAVRTYIGGDGNGSKITSECGTETAKALQEKLNGNKRVRSHAPRTGGNSHPSTRCDATAYGRTPSAPDYQLDTSDPFQECEKLDIDQIEGRSNGDLAHRLSNGEYVVSYRGIMKLANRHNIDFPTVIKDNKAVIAYAQQGRTARLSGKPVKLYNNQIDTAIELAKRNAARQLLPLPEIKALEKKTQLEVEFDWEKAKAKSLELVPEANLNCIINDLVKTDKLAQKHPSDYSRLEWLLIYDTCLKDNAEFNSNDNNDDNDNGDKTPLSPTDKFAECRDAAKDFTRLSWLRSDMLKDGTLSGDWMDDDFAKLKQACEIDASLFGKELGYWTVELQPNANNPWRYDRRYRFWLTPMSRRCFWCAETEGILPDTFIRWGRYEIKASLCLECSKKVGEGELSKERLVQKFDEVYRAYGGVGRSWRVRSHALIFPDNVETVPSTEAEFIAKCKQAEKESEVDDPAPAPMVEDAQMDGDGKRKLQIDKKRNIVLIDADGTKKSMTFQEVSRTFGSNFILRLTQGIACGGDISTVELD